MMKKSYDVLIAGGGPAGLSAALVLGRARRSVLVVDNREYRNAASSGLHGFLTRDGILPYELLQLGREEIARYDVDYVTDTVTRTSRDERSGAFVSKLKAHGTITSRLILLATGVVDRLPAIPGIDEFYGTSIHHCPYCDGWEWRDRPLAIIGRGKAGLALTRKLMNWSCDLVLCTHGPARYSFAELKELNREDIRVVTTRIDHLEGNDGRLERIVFRDGTAIDREAIFFTAPQDQRCTIAGDLGCELTTQHVIKTTRRQETNIPGVYVAGDAARDVHFAIVAAAEGAKAAISMDDALAKMGRRAAANRTTARRSSSAR